MILLIHTTCIALVAVEVTEMPLVVGDCCLEVESGRGCADSAEPLTSRSYEMIGERNERGRGGPGNYTPRHPDLNLRNGKLPIKCQSDRN